MVRKLKMLPLWVEPAILIGLFVLFLAELWR